MRKIVLTIGALVLGVAVSSPAAQAVAPLAVGEGPRGQSIYVSPTRNLVAKEQWITITGKNFDERIGIYVSLCVKPKPGKVPTPCSGGINLRGVSKGSVWISAKPPLYAKKLVTPFKAGGSFVTKIKVGPLIGKYDCRKVACVVTTRADHTNETIRTADVSVPVTFKKK